MRRRLGIHPRLLVEMDRGKVRCEFLSSSLFDLSDPLQENMFIPSYYAICFRMNTEQRSIHF